MLFIEIFQVFFICQRAVCSVIHQKYRMQSLDRREATRAKPASGTAERMPVVPLSTEACLPTTSSPTV